MKDRAGCEEGLGLGQDQDQIGDAGAQALGQALQSCNNLQRLFLAQNEIGDAGAQAFGQAPQNCAASSFHSKHSLSPSSRSLSSQPMSSSGLSRSGSLRALAASSHGTPGCPSTQQPTLHGWPSKNLFLSSRDFSHAIDRPSTSPSLTRARGPAETLGNRNLASSCHPCISHVVTRTSSEDNDASGQRLRPSTSPSGTSTSGEVGLRGRDVWGPMLRPSTSPSVTCVQRQDECLNRRPNTAPSSYREQLEAIGLTADGRLQGMDKYPWQQNGDNAWKTELSVAIGKGLEDWRHSERYDQKDLGQTFFQFLNHQPRIPGEGGRCVVCIRGLCAPGHEDKLPNLKPLAHIVQAFFQLPVELLSPIAAAPNARASMMDEDGPQYLAEEVFNELVKAGVPSHTFCMLAVTMHGLHSAEQGDPVCSIARPEHCMSVASFGGGMTAGNAMRIALRELSQLFGLRPCALFDCLMCDTGVENLELCNGQLDLCPVCLRCLHWSVGFGFQVRYKALRDEFVKVDTEETPILECRGTISLYERRLDRLSIAGCPMLACAPGSALHLAFKGAHLAKPRPAKAPDAPPTSTLHHLQVKDDSHILVKVGFNSDMTANGCHSQGPVVSKPKCNRHVFLCVLSAVLLMGLAVLVVFTR